MRSPLTAEMQLDVTLSAICSRNRYTTDPAAVIRELVAAAGDRVDILARVAGTWAGYFETRETSAIVTALRGIPGADRWVAEGRRRRGIPTHGAPMSRADVSAGG
ncbi:hypothetical protein JOF37_002896 [Microbacterium imperiale]|uniref:Uncharacterized protein n=1 Tax=Microbacterium imperiale TaxID=33884 RepID=A0A9W6HH72_9MICO|nr:hypothetical protein [Microbacterium imperiale]BFE39370.1 hypothetical protein GCM10017544_03260 [Microbacterium imperiale]GLJ79763.1 hypothetical protein GCM10017586_14450 [Microbacterium imperiale]